MSIIDRGSPIQAEVTFRRKVAHVDTPVFFNPTSPVISLIDPSSTVVVSTQVLSGTNASSTGLYDATMQSTTTWEKGLYETKVTALDDVLQDVTIERRVFELI